MKKIKFIVFIFFIITSVSSCLYGSFKGLTSNYNNEKENLKIVFLDSINDNQNSKSEIIYSINGLSLKNQISKYDKSLVYIWSTNCSSEFCLPLYSIQSICDEKGIELFVILEYYDKNVKDYFNQTKNPIFSIDHKYYETNFVSSYTERFMDDLIGHKLNDSISWKRYYYFEKDELKDVKRTIVSN